MFKCTLDAFLAVCGLDRGGGTGSCGISSTGAEAMTKTRLTSAGLISNQSPSITSTNTNTTPIDVENCNISISKDSITIVPNDVDDGGGVTSGTGDGSGTNAIGSNEQYEPYYMQSDYTQNSNSYDAKILGNGTVAADSSKEATRNGYEESNYNASSETGQ